MKWGKARLHTLENRTIISCFREKTELMRSTGEKMHLLCKEVIVVYGVWPPIQHKIEKHTANLPVVGCCVSFCGALPIMDALWYSKISPIWVIYVLFLDPVLVFARGIM